MFDKDKYKLNLKNLNEMTKQQYGGIKLKEHRFTSDPLATTKSTALRTNKRFSKKVKSSSRPKLNLQFDTKNN